eukprot:SAG31_NODE_3180_length_4582_cov_2.985501_5_plen_157_part_00
MGISSVFYSSAVDSLANVNQLLVPAFPHPLVASGQAAPGANLCRKQQGLHLGHAVDRLALPTPWQQGQFSEKSSSSSICGEPRSEEARTGRPSPRLCMWREGYLQCTHRIAPIRRSTCTITSRDRSHNHTKEVKRTEHAGNCDISQNVIRKADAGI